MNSSELCSICPIRQAPEAKQASLCAARDVIRLTSSGQSWHEKAREYVTDTCFLDLQKIGRGALQLDPEDPDITLAEQCAANFDPQDENPPVCELE
jgi:hypothetical protein